MHTYDIHLIIIVLFHLILIKLYKTHKNLIIKNIKLFYFILVINIFCRLFLFFLSNKYIGFRQIKRLAAFMMYVKKRSYFITVKKRLMSGHVALYLVQLHTLIFTAKE